MASIGNLSVALTDPWGLPFNLTFTYLELVTTTNTTAAGLPWTCSPNLSVRQGGRYAALGFSLFNTFAVGFARPSAYQPGRGRVAFGQATNVPASTGPRLQTNPNVNPDTAMGCLCSF
jgi:hypothetical protein